MSEAAPATPEAFSQAAPQNEIADTVRLSINLAPAVAENLRSYSRRKGVSVTEAVRRAIGTLMYIDAAQARGASIHVKEDNNNLREVQFLV
jgi:hypothetical protein